MSSHRRWMLYVPELEPAGFFFFYFKGDTGRSYSLRRYGSAHVPPVVRSQRDLRHTAEEILAMATCAVEAAPHPVEDLEHWRSLTQRCEAEHLGRMAGVDRDAPQPASTRSDRPAAPAPAREAAAAHVGPFVSQHGRPLRTMEDWRQQHPPHHWRAGYSAMELARVWSSANGFPASFQRAFLGSDLEALRLERAVVEHETDVPGRGRPSCTDLMAFARTPVGDTVVVGVEGKVDESFGPRVGEWRRAGDTDAHRANREVRLSGLREALQIDGAQVDGLRYQLLHRAFSALATARDAGARAAVLVVHSLEGRGARGDNWHDFQAFARAMGAQVTSDGAAVRVGDRMGVGFWVSWVTEPRSGGRPPEFA